MEMQERQRKRRSEPPEVRRLQLIMAAIDSISKRGFSDTTLKHVTETANLSHGVVNYHFDSKEALYDAALGFLAQEHYENWLRHYEAAEPTAAHRLAAIIRADFDKSVCTHKRLAVWFAFWGQAKYRPNYLKIHNRYDVERYERIGLICEQIAAEGKYANVSPERAARMLESLIDGQWLNLMLYPTITDRTECRTECFDLLSRYFPRHFNEAGALSSLECAQS